MTHVANQKSLIFLSLLCFGLADVRDGLGPFLGVYLQDLGWEADSIGVMMSIGGIIGMLFSTSAGVLSDNTKYKRSLLALSAIAITFGLGLILLYQSTFIVATSQVIQGLAGALIAPLVNAITLGMVGQKLLPKRLGTNEAFNHLGNAFSAAVGGLAGYYYGIVAVFIVMGCMAVISVVAVFMIDKDSIDHNVARGFHHDKVYDEKSNGILQSFKIILQYKLLVIFGIIIGLFHLSNAAMLPLLGQSMVDGFDVNPALYTALTIIVAQIVMIFTALFAANIAQTKGYMMPMCIALGALFVRGLIGGFYHSPWAILPVQILDGFGAGIIGVAMPGIIAKILDNSGHVNLGLGFAVTLSGIGAALSTIYGGIVAKHYGYDMAFFALAFVSLVGLVLWIRYFKNHIV